MRDTSSSIDSALTALASQPGILVQIDMPLHTFRLTSLDANFSYDSQTWESADVAIDSVAWRASGSSSARMTLGDPDGAYWRLALGGVGETPQMQDARVLVWNVYAEVPDEAVPMWSGRVGAVRRDGVTLTCELFVTSSLTSSPRRRVQQVINPIYLIPAGKVITIGGQKWKLERKTNGA